MASSSENLSLFDSWNFRPTFPDSWISEAYARDTDALTRALQQSLSTSLPPPPPPLDYSSAAAAGGGEDSLINSLLPTNFAGTTSNPDTPTPISCSSDPDSAPTPAPKPRRSTNSTTTSSAPGATGKVTKRKSRAASKKSQTTFITADPANFRQMVQQVTGGVRFTDAMVPVLKPEPHRLGGGGGGGGGLLPTLDTSAFLLDHHRQIQQQQPGGGGGGPEGPMSFSQALVGDGPDGGGAGLDFGTFSNFPTLESWKVI
ncbi:unnamed protein product [Linum tenue]|uniref:VQ domain-containing protein n=1 Tax=Linum tenue TaxID=586396 RepID=A0AAV0JB38_9ROSI|nr:unnamed protein product [Linum tenue]